jgi:high-affinity Fe2+/Pb2+ permease
MAFIAVVREGVELAFFITAAFFAGNNENVGSNTIQTLAGVVLGLGTSILLGWSLFATTVRMDLRRFFQVTGFILILFAGGLVAHGIHEFNEVGWIPNIIEHVWDVNAVIDENSVFGQLLKALFGYNGNPSLTEMIGYFAYLIIVAIFFQRNNTIKQAIAEAAPVQALRRHTAQVRMRMNTNTHSSRKARASMGRKASGAKASAVATVRIKAATSTSRSFRRISFFMRQQVSFRYVRSRSTHATRAPHR